MAVTLPRFKVASGKDQLGALAALDGLTEVEIRRVDFPYGPADDGLTEVKIKRLVVLSYTPAGTPQDSILNWYDLGQKDVTVQFSYRAGAADVVRTYNMIVLNVVLRMQGSDQDRYVITLGMTNTELAKQRQARL